jgi:hypothetical protein
LSFIGKAYDPGSVFMAAAKDNAPVIWTGYAKPIEANAPAFAQTPSCPPDERLGRESRDEQSKEDK